MLSSALSAMMRAKPLRFPVYKTHDSRWSIKFLLSRQKNQKIFEISPNALYKPVFSAYVPCL